MDQTSAEAAGTFPGIVDILSSAHG